MGVSNPHLINNADLKNFLSEKEWLVEETEFDIKKINSYETIFAIGNGYLGHRGSLEEGHLAALPGTYINGVFDHFDSFIVDLINAPNWAELSIYVEGKKLSLHNCQILDFYRALDIRNGCLYRFTRFQDDQGRITRYESIRYANLADKHLFENRITITAENYSGSVVVESIIDGHVFNLDLEPAYKEIKHFAPEVKWDKWSKSKHLENHTTEGLDDGVYLEMKTRDRPHHIGYAASLNAKGQKNIRLDYEKVQETAQFEIQEGETIQIEKLVSIYTSRDVEQDQVKASCQQTLTQGLSQSFEQRFQLHQIAWEHLWNDCDMEIEGDAKASHAVRFNIYHMLITANPDDPRANVGAKSMSGEGYKGHIFWDTEIFLLPFYIFTQPETAKALLLYRYHTMKGAREYAQQAGYKGVRFPWESADTGHEATPPWSADGSIRIWTGERELHITSAVVFGILSYYTATQDHEFFTQYGAEILFETARFWESRLEYNEREDRYELTELEGPDEFHELVNNSVYTNWLTKWNLEKSVEYYNLVKENFPEDFKTISSKLQLSEAEVAEWNRKAGKVYIPFDPKQKLIEEFEGYFKLKDVPITEWDENYMPIFPKGYNHDNSQGTTLIKQPDVVMLLYILPDEFSDEVKKANYEYYEARTMHKSSLSPSVHTIMGIETNNYEKALQYFERAAYVDLIDNQGNTEWGMHIASAGGTWQSIANGFGGLRIKNQRLTFKPWLPDTWKEIRFKIKWRGDDLKIHINQARATFLWETQKNDMLNIDVKGKGLDLPPNKLTSVELK